MTINFKLKELDQIVPWGKEPALRLSWFGMTDGELWLEFGTQTIYEYSKEAIDYFGERATRYNDYQLVRFIEDFTELFSNINETIPEFFYDVTQDLNTFMFNADKCLAIYDSEEDELFDTYFEAYSDLTSWIHQRTFNSIHLIGGPTLSFFRRKSKVRIVWSTEYILENGIHLWTAKDGFYEMDFRSFVVEIKKFGQNFFTQMDKQIELALAKDWGKIEVDKQLLKEEHQQRKKDFSAALSNLEQNQQVSTNWTKIEELYQQMSNELKNT